MVLFLINPPKSPTILAAAYHRPLTGFRRSMIPAVFIGAITGRWMVSPISPRVF